MADQKRTAEEQALLDIDNEIQSRIEDSYYELSANLSVLQDLLQDEDDPRLSKMVDSLKRMNDDFNKLDAIGKLF